MTINGSFVQYQQKQNSTKQGKQKKDLASFVGKSKTGETLPKQHVDSREIRHLQSSLLKSRALNNNKISFEGYTKSITKTEAKYSYGTHGGGKWVTIEANGVSDEIGNDYAVTGKDKSKSLEWWYSSDWERQHPNINKNTPIEVKAKIYIADLGEHITEEIRQQHDFVAEPTISTAVLEGNIEKVKALLNFNLNIDAKNNKGFTALHHSAEKNHLEIVKFLVEKGADVNAKNNKGFTALHLASEKNHLEIVKLLAEKGADVNSKNNDDFTALHLASEKNHPEIVKFLVKKGADVNAFSKYCTYPVDYAAEKNNLEMVKFLVEKGANTSFSVNGAAKNNNLEMVKFLVKNGAGVNQPHSNTAPLHDAARHDNLEMVEFLLSHGADPNPRCESTPWSQAKEGSRVEKLLKNYTLTAIKPAEKEYEIFQEKMNSQGDGWIGDTKRFFIEGDLKKEAKLEADAETITYQNNLLQVNNNLLELQKTAQANREKLIQKRASEKEIDESTKLAEYYKRLINTENKNGFGKMAGYDDIKNVLKDHVCAPIALEHQGESSATNDVPAGILFYGPMGTGKTTFATALAGHTECHYERISHERNPEDTFEKIEKEAEKAKKRFTEEQKRTILHLDEIEILARHEDTAGRLKAFLDNSSIDYHCTLFVTTNYPDKIDPALLRGERFMKVALPPADKKNAADIVKHYTEAAGTNGDIKYEEIAEHIVKHQEQQEAFSNDLIKETVIRVGKKAAKLGQKISHTDLNDAFKAEYPDISKTALELFEKNMKLLSPQKAR